MTTPNHSPMQRPGQEEDEPSKSPNLVLIYGITALALAAAIAVALLIVFPFYLRR